MRPWGGGGNGCGAPRSLMLGLLLDWVQGKPCKSSLRMLFQILRYRHTDSFWRPHPQPPTLPQTDGWMNRWTDSQSGNSKIGSNSFSVIPNIWNIRLGSRTRLCFRDFTCWWYENIVVKLCSVGILGHNGNSPPPLPTTWGTFKGGLSI